jgi:putative ABC transport system ATP-binding protein
VTAPMLEIAGLRFAWPGQAEDCLDIEALSVAAGETVFLYGPSGCGKSTLLSLMAGVLQPQHGSVMLHGRGWADLRPAQRDRYRVDQMGYIFQQFNLLPYLSVLDNTLAPCRFSAQRAAAAIRQSGSLERAAQGWLGGMGLPAALWDRPARDLSVGQQQRVAAARALIGSPALVIADEPTSALDENRRNTFLDLLLSSCRTANSALVFVSHDQRMADRFQRRIALPDINRAARHDDEVPA